MPANPKFIRLLKGLLRATEADRIVWEKSAFPGSYSTILDDGRGLVGIEVEGDGTYEPVQYSAYFADASGKPLESIEMTPDEEGKQADEHVVKDLFDVVGRQSERVATLLDRSLKWVESKV